MATAVNDIYTVPSGTTVYAGRYASVAAPVAEFIGAPTSGTTPLTVTFTDQSTGSITSRVWDFGDGTSSTSANPSKVYSTAGNYTVALTVTGPGGSNTRTRASYVAATAGSSPPPPPPPAPGTTVANLRLTPSATGTMPYASPALIPRGTVPAGQTLTSQDDANLRVAILNTHDDGSARVVVAAGSKAVAASTPETVRLQLATSATGSSLTTSAIATAFAAGGFVLSLGGAGSASLTSFLSPAITWYASPQVISSMYRVPVSGQTSLELVVYIRAFAGGRAHWRAVLELSKMDSATPVKPTAVTYSGGTLTVNGTVVTSSIASTGPAGSGEGNHAAFRAQQVFEGWVGGDPQVACMQLHTEWQADPALWKMDQASTADLSGYASDAYAPWGTGRQRATGMGSGGDHASIGPLPQWESRLLQTGDVRCAKATIASALSVLSFNVNYRDSTTGLVPTFSQLTGRSQQTNWPSQSNVNDAACWEVAHHPAAGLMAFLASGGDPIFIEIAQKVAVWNGTWSGFGGTAVGVFGRPYQWRGRAWCMRSLGHAIMLTPDGNAWKAPAIATVSANVTFFDEWRNDSRAVLNHVWEETVALAVDDAPSRPGFQSSSWFQHYAITELHKLHASRLLTGSGQTALGVFTDWLALMPVRWVNEQTNGGWRYAPYYTAIGRLLSSGSNGIDSLSTWGAQMAWAHSDSPPAATGSWFYFLNYKADAYTEYTADNTAGALYPSYLWAALCAAVERNVAGAATAFATVLAGITNLATWRQGFGADPRWGSTPRGVGTGWGTGSDVGSISGNVWTAGRDSNDLINAASLATLVPLRMYELAGSRLDAMEAAVQAELPGYNDAGNSKWNGVSDAWGGLAYDTRQGFERAWYAAEGGHDASINNGTYQHTVRTGRWSMVRPPTPHTVFSPYYRGATGYSRKASRTISGSSWSDVEALQALVDVYGPTARGNSDQVTLTNGSGFTEVRVFREETGAWVVYGGLTPFSATGALPTEWRYDYIYDHSVPTDPLKSSKRPTPRHTYHSKVFAYNFGAAGSLLMGCRSQWVQDLATGNWSLPAPAGGDPTWYPAENMIGVWDEVTGKYHVTSSNLSTDSSDRSYWFKPSDGTFGKTGVLKPIAHNVTDRSASTRRGRVLHAIDYGDYCKPTTLFVTNMDTGVQTQNAITMGSSWSGVTFQGAAGSNYYDRQGMTFIAPLNKYLINVYCSLGSVWAWVDATTFVCERATNMTGSVGVPYTLEGKVQFFEDAGVLVYYSPADENTRYMRATA